jgi:hypothetical protein
MIMKNNGGPAFPQPPCADSSGGFLLPTHFGLEGMTLRDYFAAKAMQSLISLMENTEDADAEMRKLGLGEGEFDKLVAKCAYDYADAMIERRDR